MTEGQSVKEAVEQTTLIVSAIAAGDKEIEVGRLVFDATNKGELVLTGSGTEAATLQEAWEQIQQAETLPKRGARVDENGVRMTTSQDVRRGDDDYKWAARQLLEMEYGFEVEVGD